jgi:hypothetical protein
MKDREKGEGEGKGREKECWDKAVVERGMNRYMTDELR